jgi:adenylate kinase
MHKIFILGPQGCGKGTQAVLLAKKLAIPQLSMGQLLREVAKTDHPLAAKIGKILTSGDLVPDEIAVQVLDARLRQPDTSQGYILDGFPRNEEQFLAFEKYSQPNMVIVIEVPHQVSIDRLTKRAVIEKRLDDTPAVIERRLQIYEQDTRPMIKHYEERGIAKFIDGTGTVAEVAEEIAKIFDNGDNVGRG